MSAEPVPLAGAMTEMAERMRAMGLPADPVRALLDAVGPRRLPPADLTAPLDDDPRGVAALRVLISRFGFMPNYRFAVTQNSHPGFMSQNLGMLFVDWDARDSRHPERGPRTLSFQCTLPVYVDADEATPEQWLPWLASVLCYIAVHEVLEFITVDGVRVFDPHDPERNAAAERYGLVPRLRSYIEPE